MLLEMLGTAGAGCLLVCGYLAICKKKIEKEIAKKNCIAVSIQWMPFNHTVKAKKEESQFRVSYKDMDGIIHAAVCSVAPFSEVNWKTEV